jgi:phenylacetate-CoA ligase
MQKITGRSDDMIILRGVNVFPTQIEELVLATPQLAPYFQIELRREGHMDSMTVKVEVSAEYSDTKQSAAQALTTRIKDVIGVSAVVEVNDPGGVERSQGKARRVIDLRSE